MTLYSGGMREGQSLHREKLSDLMGWTGSALAQNIPELRGSGGWKTGLLTPSKAGNRSPGSAWPLPGDFRVGERKNKAIGLVTSSLYQSTPKVNGLIQQTLMILQFLGSESGSA